MSYQIKGNYPKIYKEFIKLTTQITNNPIKKWAEDMNRHFSKKRHTNGQQTHEKILNLNSASGKYKSNHNEIPLHTSQRAKMNKSRNNRYWWGGCGERGTIVHCWWECKLLQPLWKIVWKFLKSLKNLRTTLQSSNCTTRYLSKGYKHSDSKGNMHLNVYSSNVHNSQTTERGQVSINSWMDKEDVVHIPLWITMFVSFG